MTKLEIRNAGAKDAEAILMLSWVDLEAQKRSCLCRHGTSKSIRSIWSEQDRA